MVFSSIPSYLDPSNWNQQQNPHIIGSSSANPLLPPQPHAPLQPPPQPHGGGGGGIRPGSMAERARMANIPMPETSLKCPRCESTNTKFCYFNNYSLSQPRHFCKTCRRYWTRGGALRNVPVGGGCRRNKRSKSSSSASKSPGSSDRQTSSNPCSTSTASTSRLGGVHLPPLRFMSPLGQLNDSFAADHMALHNYSGGIGGASSVGMTSDMNFHGGVSNFLGGGGGVASLLSSEGGGGGGIEPWRMQQFPFFGTGIDISSPPQGLYQFQGGGECGFVGDEGSHHQQHQEVAMRPKFLSPMLNQQRPPVKMEDNNSNNNNNNNNNADGNNNLIRRQMLGGNEQWNGPTAAPNWTDLSSFSSSSTSNQL